MSPSSAKRLDCVRLAVALAPPATAAVPPKSGSKLRALQTLARRAKCLRVPRSVWTASGLPALWHRPRPLLSLQKARASSTHSKRWRHVPNVSEFREAFGLRPACRRFGIARDRCCPSKKREQAPRTPNAGATYQMSPSSAKRLDCVRLAGALASPATAAVPPKSASKLHALQTLARPSLLLPETPLAFPSFSSLLGLQPFQENFHFL